LADFALIYPTLHFQRAAAPALRGYRYALLADDALRFHLFDDTRGTVIANAELTLHPEIDALRFSVTVTA
jgi:hypothetical protein